MIDSNYYSNKKGIYKDLYKALDADKKPKEIFKNFSAKKGIYKDLYRQIEEDKKAKKRDNFIHKFPFKSLAYISNIGEAIKPIIGLLLARLSYIPSLLYALIAIISKLIEPPKEDQNKSKTVTKEIVYQSLASFLLPDLVVKSSRKISNTLINKIPVQKKRLIITFTQNIGWLSSLIKKLKKENISGYRNFALSVVGISSLAFAVKPIDNFVGNSLNKIYNPKGRIYYERR